MRTGGRIQRGSLGAESPKLNTSILVLGQKQELFLILQPQKPRESEFLIASKVSIPVCRDRAWVGDQNSSWDTHPWWTAGADTPSFHGENKLYLPPTSAYLLSDFRAPFLKGECYKSLNNHWGSTPSIMESTLALGRDMAFWSVLKVRMIHSVVSSFKS